MGPCIPDRIGIWKCWFLWREENWRKTLAARTRTNNKLNLGHISGRQALSPHQILTQGCLWRNKVCCRRFQILNQRFFKAFKSANVEHSFSSTVFRKARKMDWVKIRKQIGRDWPMSALECDVRVPKTARPFGHVQCL